MFQPSVATWFRKLCFPVIAVASPGLVLADVFTVGPGGTHSQIQDAVNAALAHSGDDEIRIRGGLSMSGQIVTITQMVNERLDISGGWNTTYDQQVITHHQTVLSASEEGRTLTVDAEAGVVTIRSLSLLSGRSVSGANARLTARNDARLEVSDCSIGYGIADGGGALVASGGGASLAAYNSAVLVIERCKVNNNHVTGAYGNTAGLSAFAMDDARIGMSDLRIFNNTLQVSFGYAGGLSVGAAGNGLVELDNLEISGNHIIGAASASPLGSGLNVSLNSPGESNAQILMRRLRVTDNATTETTSAKYQVHLFANSNNIVVLGDSEISRSETDGGVLAGISDSADISLVNLTVPDNAGFDLAVNGAVNISNTLADTTDASIASANVNNSLFGTDPLYLERVDGIYHLLPSSPAIDAGTSTPPGGLGSLDLDGNPRIMGARVDLGANEFNNPFLFRDGFEATTP